MAVTPTNLKIIPGDKMLAVRWAVTSTEGLGGFLLHWRPKGSTVPWATVEVGAAIREETISNLTDGITYDVQVRALVAGGIAQGVGVPVAPTPPPPPPPPVETQAEKEAREKREREEHTPPPLPATHPHIMVIVEENRDRSQVIGSGSFPFLNQLNGKYGQTENWDGVSHPSLPNYLALISGSTQGHDGDDNSPSQPLLTAPNIGDQLTGAGIPWAAYAESGGASKHEPFKYFTSTASSTKNAGSLISDLNSASPPAFVFYTPSLINDGHDGSDAQCDASIKSLVEGVQSTKWYATGGVIILTWDEDEGEGKIATVVVAEAAKGKALGASGSHYGTLAAIQDAYKVPRLGNAQSATSTLTPLITGAVVPPPPPPPPPVEEPTSTWKGYSAQNPMPAGTVPYSPSSPFNAPIPSNPVLLSNSQAMVSYILGLNSTFMPGNMTTAGSKPVYYAATTDPEYTVQLTEGWGSNPLIGRKIKCPAAAKPGGGSDAHMVIVQPDGEEIDLWQAKAPGAGKIIASWGSGGKYMTGDGLGGAANAANFNLPAGLIRAQEIIGGVIPHALFAVVSVNRNGFVYPASHTDGSGSSANMPYEGQRFYLAYTDAEIAALKLPAWKATIVTALAHYGFYVGDSGGSGLDFQFESETQYTAFGLQNPLAVYAAAHGLPTWQGEYVFHLSEGVDWTRLRALLP